MGYDCGMVGHRSRRKRACIRSPIGVVHRHDDECNDQCKHGGSQKPPAEQPQFRRHLISIALFFLVRASITNNNFSCCDNYEVEQKSF